MKVIFVLMACLLFTFLHAQTTKVEGTVRDLKTGEVLAGVSITIQIAKGIYGGVSNQKGDFSINILPGADSIWFSMIGYRHAAFALTHLPIDRVLNISLAPESVTLHAVVVQPLTALDIIHQAAQKLPSFIPSRDFESEVFYREIIKNDSE